MATYLISYDLSDPSKEDDLLKYIKGFGWARASKSSYAVSTTSKTPDQIVTDIRKLTNDAITVYVLSIRKPYSGLGPKDVNDWLEANLP